MSEKIQFKPLKKKRPSRQKAEESDEEEDFNKDAMGDLLEIQKLRKRAKGVNVVTLASGKKVTKVDEFLNDEPDPFKLKTGGLLTIDKAKQAANIERENENIGTQFSKGNAFRPLCNTLSYFHFLLDTIKRPEFVTRTKKCGSSSMSR